VLVFGVVGLLCRRQYHRLETLVPEMTCCLSSGALNSTHSLTIHFPVLLRVRGWAALSTAVGQHFAHGWLQYDCDPLVVAIIPSRLNRCVCFVASFWTRSIRVISRTSWFLYRLKLNMMKLFITVNTELANDVGYTSILFCAYDHYSYCQFLSLRCVGADCRWNSTRSSLYIVAG